MYCILSGDGGIDHYRSATSTLNPSRVDPVYTYLLVYYFEQTSLQFYKQQYFLNTLNLKTKHTFFRNLLCRSDVYFMKYLK